MDTTPHKLILDGKDVSSGCSGVVLDVHVGEVTTVKITYFVLTAEVKDGVITLTTE